MKCNAMQWPRSQLVHTCYARKPPHLDSHDLWGTRKVHVPLTPECAIGSRAHILSALVTTSDHGFT